MFVIWLNQTNQNQEFNSTVVYILFSKLKFHKEGLLCHAVPWYTSQHGRKKKFNVTTLPCWQQDVFRMWFSDPFTQRKSLRHTSRGFRAGRRWRSPCAYTERSNEAPSSGCPWAELHPGRAGSETPCPPETQAGWTYGPVSETFSLNAVISARYEQGINAQGVTIWEPFSLQ